MSQPNDIRGLILDMDGVLWRETEPIGDLPAIFDIIHQHSWQVTLATNNATRTTGMYLEKLANFGVTTLSPENIVNSSTATAHYLAERFPGGGPVFVVGEQALLDDLQAVGFYPAQMEVLAVVCAMDRQLNYEKLTQATLLVRSGAPLVATNPDRTFPTPRGLVPGAGAILALLEAATDVQATIVGKPSPEMYRIALQRMGLDAQNVLVVGDRLETDIAGAQALGCLSGLVLSGVTNPTQAAAWRPSPDFVADDLGGLISRLAAGSL